MHKHYHRNISKTIHILTGLGLKESKYFDEKIQQRDDKITKLLELIEEMQEDNRNLTSINEQFKQIILNLKSKLKVEQENCHTVMQIIEAPSDNNNNNNVHL